ncbi:MAG: signal peptide peptidase SppA [Planctomycetes bacterium]|nr:signal peptide peptidase SppA [Planctomycetota bacterium]
MNAKQTILILSAAIVLPACAPQSSGYLITPVPVDQQLKETVVAQDSGWGVQDKIAVVDVDGMIMNSRRKGGLFGPGENPMSMFVEKIDKAQADPDVKALVVRINSPGGGVTASDVMYNRLLQFRQARKVPVVAVIEDVGASGGYMIACGADTIVAHPTSITGSIGVIVQTVNFTGTMKMLGIEARALVSGKHKDMGSMLKPYDEKDLAILQAIVDEFYKRFLDTVKKSRNRIEPPIVESLADGRVYTGQQAMDKGLVDKLGTVQDAVVLAKSMCGSQKVKLVIYHRPLGYKPNVYSQSPDVAPQANLINIDADSLAGLDHPQFLYLWTGK